MPHAKNLIHSDPSYLYYVPRAHNPNDYLCQEAWLYARCHDVCEINHGYFVVTSLWLDGFFCLNQPDFDLDEFLDEFLDGCPDILIQFFGAVHRAHRRLPPPIESLYLEALYQSDLEDSFKKYARTKNNLQWKTINATRNTVRSIKSPIMSCFVALQLRSCFEVIKGIWNQEVACGSKEELIPHMTGLLDNSLSALNSMQENGGVDRGACWVSLREIDRFTSEVLKDWDRRWG